MQINIAETSALMNTSITGRSLQIAHDAKTVGVVAYVDIVAKPRGGSDFGWLAVEIAAAQHPQPAIACGPGGRILGGVAIIVVPAVFHPFGGVAGGIVK